MLGPTLPACRCITHTAPECLQSFLASHVNNTLEDFTAARGLAHCPFGPVNFPL